MNTLYKNIRKKTSPAIIAATSPTTTINANGIHNGDNTHHHDQCITPTSFKTIKAIVNKPRNPIPPLADELLPDILTPSKIKMQTSIYI
tara:strand:- start:2808 stop:3074 length:267 start_codon:yes stop_codon:yes gene_type:complete